MTEQTEVQEPRRPISQDEITDWYTERPFATEEALQTLEHSPVQYMAAFAAKQRQALAYPDKVAELNKHSKTARRILEKTGYWEAVLVDLRSGQPSVTNVQLALWSLASTQKGFKVRKDKMGPRVDRMNFFGAPVLEDIALTSMHIEPDTKRALAEFVENNQDCREYFNPEAGHIQATAQAWLLHKMNWQGNPLLSAQGLSLQEPNPMLFAMSNQLSVFMKQARRSGEYQSLPQWVWRTDRALTQYWDDVAMAKAGSAVVGNQQGRMWRLVFDQQGGENYTNYLFARHALKEQANKTLWRCLQEPPENLDAEFAEVLADLQDEGDSPEFNMLLNEKLGVLWAAASLRRSDRACIKLLNTHENAKSYLETYVQDGLPLVAERRAAFWQKYVLLQGWLDQDGKGPTTIFTPQHGSIQKDRIDAGAALSERLRHGYKQRDLNVFQDGTTTRSHTNSPLDRRVGIINAVSLAKRLFSSGGTQRAYDSLLGDIRTQLSGFGKREYHSLFRLLPKEVQTFIANNGVEW